MNNKETADMLMSIASSTYKVLIESKNENGRKILLNIVKNCLENDYSFRTLFASAKIIIDDVPGEEEQLNKEYKETKLKEEEEHKRE